MPIGGLGRESSEIQMVSMQSQRAWWLWPILAAALMYYPSIQFGYVLDDAALFDRAGAVRDWGSLWQFATQPFLGYQGYFRPLPLLMVGTEQLLWGSGPAVSHAMAVLLQALNAALVAALAWQIAAARADLAANREWIAAAAGCVYALHPVLIESVAWISCRFELLLTLFCLLALWADRLLLRTPLRVPLVALLFLAAALSKEMALGFALLLPFWHLVFERDATTVSGLFRSYRQQGHLQVYAAVVAAGLIYLAMRSMALQRLHLPAQAQFYETATLEHAWVVFKSFAQYATLSFWPFASISPLHTLSAETVFGEPQVIAGLLLVVALCAVACLMLRARWRYSALNACFALSLFPVLNFIPLQIGDNYVHDRFLNFPLVFVILWAVLTLAGWHPPALSIKARRLVLVLVLGFWTGSSILSIRVTLPFWRDNLSVWKLAYLESPASIQAQTGLMDAYAAAGLHGQVIGLADHIARSGGRVNDAMLASVVLALASSGYSVTPVLPELERRLENLGSQGKSQVANHNYLGWLYLMAGQFEPSRRTFLQALQKDPSYTPALYGLAILLEVHGDRAQAQKWLQRWESNARPAQRDSGRRQYDQQVALYRERASATPDGRVVHSLEDLARAPGRYGVPQSP